jgi:hypothetical protein
MRRFAKARLPALPRVAEVSIGDTASLRLFPAFVGKMFAACEVNQDRASEREQQKCGINVPASPQRTPDHAAPALAPACPIVSQCAGHTEMNMNTSAASLKP